MKTARTTSLLPLAGAPPISERGREREAAILEVAAEYFFEFGYGATSLDAIARRAGGSKSTLYRYFPSKRDLFHAVVTSVVADVARVRLDPDADVYDSLYHFAYERLSVVFAPRHWSLLRLIMAERDRFPRIADAYLQIGPKRGRERLAAYFRALVERKALRLEDPQESAEFFIGMLMHEWYLKYLYSVERLPTRELRERRAAHVVRSFLSSSRT